MPFQRAGADRDHHPLAIGDGLDSDKETFQYQTLSAVQISQYNISCSHYAMARVFNLARFHTLLIPRDCGGLMPSRTPQNYVFKNKYDSTRTDENCVIGTSQKPGRLNTLRHGPKTFVRSGTSCLFTISSPSFNFQNTVYTRTRPRGNLVKMLYN